jgi:hypothetical protein
MNVRIAAGIALAFLAVFGLPSKLTLPSLPRVAVTVTEPSPEMKTKVAPVAEALRSASPVDRAIWASVWEKAAIVVAGDAVSPEIAFTDTRSLRQFTVLALDIAWRRLGGNKAGKYTGLREAVESVLGETVGNEVVPVTPDVRRAYSDAARAVAWAGIYGG